MSLATLSRKCRKCHQSGAVRSDPPGSNTTNRQSAHIFNKVSHNTEFSINGSHRSNHYIGSGSHRTTTTRTCEAQTTTIKPSVLSGRAAMRRALSVRADADIVQPDSNFPGNDSQGIYIFNKKLKHDCVVNTQPPDCTQLSGQKCGSFVGTRLNPTTHIQKDFGVAQSYDDYLSKRLLPQCTNIVNSHRKINNIGPTNARCGRF